MNGGNYIVKTNNELDARIAVAESEDEWGEVELDAELVFDGGTEYKKVIEIL